VTIDATTQNRDIANNATVCWADAVDLFGQQAVRLVKSICPAPRRQIFNSPALVRRR